MKYFLENVKNWSQFVCLYGVAKFGSVSVFRIRFRFGGIRFRFGLGPIKNSVRSSVFGPETENRSITSKNLTYAYQF